MAKKVTKSSRSSSHLYSCPQLFIVTNFRTSLYKKLGVWRTIPGELRIGES